MTELLKPQKISCVMLPNFDLQFKLQVDASTSGAGAVLIQEDAHGIEHPVSYFSRRFPKFSGLTSEKGPVTLWIRHQPLELGIVVSSPTWVVFEGLLLSWLCKTFRDDNFKVTL